jgi:hypothetical protein
MKIGDLVKVKKCPTEAEGFSHLTCQCFFCASQSNRIGFVIGPGPRNQWEVMFDTGMWRLDDFEEARGEVQVISESG